MPRRKATRELHCGINGVKVGTVRRKSGTFEFVYDDEWLGAEYAHSISLSLPMTSKRHTGERVRYFFDNLLPDNEEVRQQIVDRIGAYSTDTMDLLSAIGRDCVGALSLSLTEIPPEPSMQMNPVDENEINEILNHAVSGHTLGMGDDDTFRISIAGAQEKTALTYHRGQWHQPIGNTPTTHIFKMAMGKLPGGINMEQSVDNEWFCLRFMHHLGFDVAHAEIEVFGEQKVLVVERFDRHTDEDGQILRISQEDMCQALGRAGQSKYEDKGGPGAFEISDLLATSQQGLKDQQVFFLSQYVFWLLCAIDGHAKNFSVYLDASGYWLTPIYDVLSAYPTLGKIQPKKAKMAMRVKSKNSHYHWHKILPRHWPNHAKFSGLSPDIAQELIGAINEELQGALDKTWADAPEHFHQETGGKITKGVLDLARKKLLI